MTFRWPGRWRVEPSQRGPAGDGATALKAGLSSGKVWLAVDAIENCVKWREWVVFWDVVCKYMLRDVARSMFGFGVMGVRKAKVAAGSNAAVNLFQPVGQRQMALTHCTSR